MAFFPKTLGDLQRFDIQVVPPGHFVTDMMQLLMMITAKRHGENHTLLLAFALADKIASIKLTTTTAMLTSMLANSVQVFACG